MTTFQQGLMIGEVAELTGEKVPTVHNVLIHFKWNKNKTITEMAYAISKCKEVEEKCGISQTFARALLLEFDGNVDAVLSNWPETEEKLVKTFSIKSKMTESASRKLLKETSYDIAVAYSTALLRGYIS